MADFPRKIGTYSSGEPGPLLLVLAGLHGNEASGIFALQRVLQRLSRRKPSFRGALVGLSGNLPALREQVRFFDVDLNRIWSMEHRERIAKLAPSERNVEERELMELLPIMDSILQGDFSDRFLIDLHSTSAPGGMFSIVTRQLRNRELASALHAPVLFDLATSLSTTTSIYMDDMELCGLAFEAGQHFAPETIDRHEAALWLLLEKVGCISYEENEFELDRCHRHLVEGARHLPHYVRVIHRHAIEPGAEFRMYPGFTNFHEVYQAEPVARNRYGEIKCPTAGLMLMPLYQKKGNSGFFIMEKLYEPLV